MWKFGIFTWRIKEGYWKFEQMDIGDNWAKQQIWILN